MQVFHSNFDAVSDEFIQLLETCDFYAMDQEMTGINVGNHRDDFSFTPSQSYGPKRAAAAAYCAFQVGICLFHKKANGKPGYEARPFNFWLRQRGPSASDVTLNFSAVDFLLENHMNFQTWLSEGIHYCGAAKEDEERAKFFQTRPQDLTEEETQWVKKKLAALTEWHDAAVKKRDCPSASTDVPVEADGADGANEAESSTNNNSNTLEDTEPHCSTKADLALYFEIKDSGKLFFSSEPSLHCFFPVWKRTKTVYTLQTEAEYKAALEADHQRRLNLFHSKIGFRRIFRALIQAKSKPMLGHNFSSDLLFFTNHHQGDLPLSYGELKEYVRELFPRMYDTKVLAAVLPETPIQNTSLGPLFAELQSQGNVNVTLPLGFESYSPSVISRSTPGSDQSSAVAHQGAYDAYMTGIVYLHFLQRNTQEQISYLESRIAVFGSCFYWNFRLGEKDTFAYCTPFHITFPKSTQNDDIDRCFMTEEELELKAKLKESKDRKKLLQSRPFSVRWSDDVSAVVLYYRPLSEEAAQEILKRAKTNAAAIAEEKRKKEAASEGEEASTSEGAQPKEQPKTPRTPRTPKSAEVHQDPLGGWTFQLLETYRADSAGSPFDRLVLPPSASTKDQTKEPDLKRSRTA